MTYDRFGNVVTNAVTYGDLTVVSSTAYDSHGRAVSQTDALGNTVYTAYDSLGNAVSISGATYPVSYSYDTAGRMTTLATTRDVEGRFATASNDAFSATYAYTPDGLDAGWTVVVTNGTTISRALTRDAYRRSLVTAITNSVDGVPI